LSGHSIAGTLFAVQEQIETVRGWIDAAQRIVVLTGAGISTDSGIPDFRGPKGLWTQNPEAEKMATIGHYMADPEVRKRSWRMRLEMGSSGSSRTRAISRSPSSRGAADSTR
jgi:NAD-dependent SIR2 family protein deacetylase